MTAFIDSSSEEVILQVKSDEEGNFLARYRLYNESGDVVAEAESFACYPSGLTISSPKGGELLHIPAPPEERVRYRLYNRRGLLLTCSDGMRTQIYAFLRMGGGK